MQIDMRSVCLSVSKEQSVLQLTVLEATLDSKNEVRKDNRLSSVAAAHISLMPEDTEDGYDILSHLLE